MDEETKPNAVATGTENSISSMALDLHLERETSNDAVPNEELAAKRSHLSQLMRENKPKEGDIWYLIPRDFLEDVMNLPVESFEQLVTEVGVLDLTGIIDETGNLYAEDEEPVATYNVCQEVFELLREWFGLNGDPVARSLITDPKSGQIEVERFPSYFQVHVIGRAGATHGVHLSTTKTFYDLFEAVRIQVLKVTSTTSLRLWFVTGDNIDTFPSSMTLFQFLEVPKKQLVLQNKFSHKLKDEGLNSAYFHLVAETYGSSGFPTDTFLKQDPLGGNLGLTNLGNTCYMNSALQCLLHIPEVNNYFFFDIFEKELNQSNPLGHNGQVAKAFGSLLHKLFPFPYQSGATNSVSPRDFKYVVGRFSSLFQGYQQQDSQEFLSWLLDALHEDLNRIYNKPYCEKPELSDSEVGDNEAVKRLAETCWKQHRARNDSVITDLFTGLYQSTLVCPTCSKTSITFDPFNDLTLPLPVNKRWYHTFTFVDDQSIRKFEVELPKTANFDELINYLAEKLSIPSDEIYLFEIFNHFFYKDFQANYNKLRFYPISEIISENDDVVIYRIKSGPEDIVVPVIHQVLDADKSYNVVHAFGVPLFVVLNQDDIKSYDRIKGELIKSVNLLAQKSISINSVDNEDDKMDQDCISDNNSVITASEFISDETSSVKSISETNFEIKYHLETRLKPVQKINIPHNRANLNNLPSLLSKFASQRTSPNIVQDENNLVDKDTSPNGKEYHDILTSGIKHDNGKTSSNSGKTNDINEMEVEEEEMNGLGSLFDSVPSDVETQLHSVDMKNSMIKKDVENDDQTDSSVLITSNMTLVCEWTNTSYQEVFKNPAWESPSMIPNEEVALSKSQLLKEQSSTVSLQDCLKVFSQPEILGDQDLWYCPKCKEHKQATKTIQIWDTADILTIHLKRFESARSFSDKIDIVVDFPVEELDMSSFVQNSGGIYDLVAVDNHYGGLGGGHYTAYAKNFRDGEWYYFNDARVTRVSSPAECVTAAAYLLFYRKRETEKVELGGSKLQSMIDEGRKEYNKKLEAMKSKIQQICQQMEQFKINDENFEEVPEKPVRSVPKKARSSIDPSDLGNKDINSVLQRKQRMISKDTESAISSPSSSDPEEG